MHALRELVRYAILAASGHNTQPWKFALKPGAIEIHPDYTRRLLVVDPDDRELWISLGCALENLLQAAQATGYAPDVAYPSEPGTADTRDFIRVTLTPDTPHATPLFEVIPLRQNTRSAYDGQAVQASRLDQLQTLALEPDVVSQFFISPADLQIVEAYVRQGNLRQLGDKAFRDELTGWLRFNQREATRLPDGLYMRCLGDPDVPRWLGRLIMNGMGAARQADADTRKLRTSSGVIVIASMADDKVAWVRVGQAYERLALKMTSLNIKSAFLNQPIEVADLRGQLQTALGLGAERPQLLLRFGYANKAVVMPRSFRRPVEQVLM